MSVGGSTALIAEAVVLGVLAIVELAIWCYRLRTDVHAHHDLIFYSRRIGIAHPIFLLVSAFLSFHGLGSGCALSLHVLTSIFCT
jgi:hypothetical protein